MKGTQHLGTIILFISPGAAEVQLMKTAYSLGLELKMTFGGNNSKYF
jgi:hypothetical protein